MRGIGRSFGMGVLALCLTLAASTAAWAQRYGPPPGRGHHMERGDVITCASNDQRTERCRVPWREARLVRQLSHAACVRGRSWGLDRRGIWVADGCRGEFAEVGFRRRDHRDWNRDIRLSCSSHGYKYQFCRVDVGHRGEVVLLHQESSTRCVRGGTWGWNRAGVWVDRGCSARFLVHRRW